MNLTKEELEKMAKLNKKLNSCLCSINGDNSIRRALIKNMQNLWLELAKKYGFDVHEVQIYKTGEIVKKPKREKETCTVCGYVGTIDEDYQGNFILHVENNKGVLSPCCEFCYSCGEGDGEPYKERDEKLTKLRDERNRKMNDKPSSTP